MPVVQREGQWFGSDVDWVVFGPYPLELNLSASDFLFDVVDYANEVFACSVGVDRRADVDGRLRVCVYDGGLELRVSELCEEFALPDDFYHDYVYAANFRVS